MNEVALFGQNEEKWYTIEEIAELCGYEPNSLKYGEANLSAIMGKMSINIEVNTKMGGYHNTKKYYSKDVLEAVKRYQILNSSPNALNDKETAIQGNVNYIGQATVKQTIDNLLDNPDTLQLLLTESLERNQALGIENRQLKEIIKVQTPKVDFYNTVTQSTDTIDMKEVAKTLNIKGLGRNNMFEFLREKKILDKNNLPYQEYVNRGYFKIVESSFITKDGVKGVNLKTVVFQKGLDFILKMAKEVK